jgi:hypothetical protein
MKKLSLVFAAIIFCLSILTLASSGRATGVAERQVKWEYLILPQRELDRKAGVTGGGGGFVTLNPNRYERALNDLGKEGWEVCGFDREGFIFKRDLSAR